MLLLLLLLLLLCVVVAPVLQGASLLTGCYRLS